MRFQAPELHPIVIRGVAALDFDHPTPIQSQAIPLALRGHAPPDPQAQESGECAINPRIPGARLDGRHNVADERSNRELLLRGLLRG